MKVAVVGYGHVGKATELLLKSIGVDVVRHDPPQDIVLEKWDDIQYALICVPTPTTDSGKLDVSIVHEAINGVPDGIEILIRCTMGPDQVGEFEGCSFWPEFIRENHVLTDLGSKDVPSLIGTFTPRVNEFVAVLRDYGLKTETVEPKITFPSLFIFVTSITFALAIISFISVILPSL